MATSYAAPGGTDRAMLTPSSTAIARVQVSSQPEPERPRSLRHQIACRMHRPATSPAATLCVTTATNETVGMHEVSVMTGVTGVPKA
jgi:hypothetical protein